MRALIGGVRRVHRANASRRTCTIEKGSITQDQNGKSIFPILASEARRGHGPSSESSGVPVALGSDWFFRLDTEP